MHVSVAAETIFHLGFLPITNSLIVTIIISILLIVVGLKMRRNIKSIPSRFQAFIELIIGAILNLTEDVAGKKQGREIFPLLATFFVFIILANFSGLLPGVGSIGIYEKKEKSVAVVEQNAFTAPVYAENVTETNIKSNTHEEKILVPIFRGPTADLNTTIALALISVFMIQYYGVKHLGAKYFKKFFNFKGPIDFFIGILELISEFSRIISFAFRLFGNIFAGEVLLTVIASLIPFIAPLPFIGLEIFVGFIQALVFMMLSLVFISMAASHHE